MIQQVPIRISTNAGDADCMVAVREWSKSAALFKGVRWWLACWGIAIVAIPIPLLHLFVPPLGVFFGPLLGIVMYRMHLGAFDITQGSVTCPACGETNGLVQKRMRWGDRFPCVRCGKSFTIHSTSLQSGTGSDG